MRSCLEGTDALGPRQVRVAYVIPTFTQTPYYNWHTSFYQFYSLNANAAYGTTITDNLDWLRTHVVTDNQWSFPYNPDKGVYTFLTSAVASNCGLVPGQTFFVTNDIAVDNGSLFSNGKRSFDVVVLTHQEYVTVSEFHQLETFVARGGRLIAMSGNLFWGEVTYSASTGIETFVAGHGFQFDGQKAWPSTYEPFQNGTVNWFGGWYRLGVYQVFGAHVLNTTRLGRFLTRAFGTSHMFTNYDYSSNEDTPVVNFTNTEIIARFYAHATNSPLPPLGLGFEADKVWAFVHKYRQGESVSFGVFGSNIIQRSEEAQYFLVYAIMDGFPETIGSCARTYCIL